MYFEFPKDFMFGAASSAVQIEAGVGEGGKGEDVLDHYWKLRPSQFGDADPAKAADFYHRYPEDIKLMKELGLKAFRFSISWSRIYPNGPEGEPNQAGIDYYYDMIDKLIEAGITPFFDLWHCDLPYWVIERGGLLTRDFIDWFAKYARTCFEAFGDRVKYWSTINEPNVNVLAAYAWGTTAPFEKDLDKALIAVHIANLAHFEAVRIYKSMNLGGKIGFVVDMLMSYGLTPNQEDQDAAERFFCWYTHLFTDPMALGHYPDALMPYDTITGRLPEGFAEEIKEKFVPMDYIGINYYSTTVQKYEKNDHLDYKWATQDVPKDDYGFNINPQGIYDTIMYCWKKYPGMELIITENGISKAKTGNYEEEVDDGYRINHLREHLRGVSRAISAGAPVTGYFHWSIMDTNELYVKGYSHMFGLIQIRFDKPTLDRVPRKSFYYYQSIIKAGRVN